MIDIKLDNDPTNKYKAKLRKILKGIRDSDAITQAEFRRLSPTADQIPRFYGLPKIHKQDCPLRPIVSAIGSISYETAKFVAKIIAPLEGTTQHHLENSQDFVEKLKGVSVSEDEALVSYDVSALFTSVPVGEALNIIRTKLESDATLGDRTKLSVDQIIELLGFCLNTTYFMAQGDLYLQKEGAAMGSPVSPLVANIFMEWFEERALATAVNPPSFWQRYVDDTFVIIKKNHVTSFTDHINNVHPSIKWTMEEEKEGKLPMLDTLAHRREDGTIKVTIYRKPTHTDQYLAMDSHHPQQHKLGVIRTLVHRAETLITDPADKVTELNNIKAALANCGYKKSHFAVALNKKAPQRGDSQTTSTSNGRVTIPYVRGVSEGLRRILVKKGIQVHFKPSNKLRDLLVAPKDKISKDDQCNVIYKVSCSDCPASYVGETGRSLGTRMSEHNHDNSAVKMHASSTGHEIRPDKAKILDKESNWFTRGIRESIYIKVHRSSLNRDVGRYYLPTVYTSLLSQMSPPGGTGSVASVQ